MTDLQVGDRVRVSFSMEGPIARFEKRSYGLCAVVLVGERYARMVPVTSLEKIDDD